MSYIEKSHKEYQQRQVVARLGIIGTTNQKGVINRVFRYLTLWGDPCVAVEFDRPASFTKDGFVVMENINEGEFLINPGMIYKRVPMTGSIMAAHLRAIQTFKRKHSFKYEKSTEQPIDIGTINLTGRPLDVTKH